MAKGAFDGMNRRDLERQLVEWGGKVEPVRRHGENRYSHPAVRWTVVAAARGKSATRQATKFLRAVSDVLAAGWKPAAVVVLMAMLWPDTVRAQEPEATVTVLAGAGVSLSDESAAIPSLRVTVDSPAFVGQAGDALGRLRVDLVLSGLPGETVKLEDPLTWTSAELYGEGQRRIGSWGGSESLLVVRGGFITRILPGDQEPRQRFARTYTAGLRAQHRGADGIVSRSIALMYGRSEVASPDRFHAGQVVVEGHVRLATVRGVDVTISGDAHLTLGKDRQRGERDVMRLGVAVGWGG